MNNDRRLVHSGKLHEVKLENLSQKTLQKHTPSYVTHICYGLLFNDHFIVAKSANIRQATAYDVDQVFRLQNTSSNMNSPSSSADQKSYLSSAIEVINEKDDILRNSFSIKHNLDKITLMCENAQSKKHWLEMFDSVLYPKQRRGSLLYTESGQFSNSSSPNKAVRSSVQSQQMLEEEFYSDQWITDTHENLLILLAERNFDKALELILSARKYAREFLKKNSQTSIPFVDEYIKGVQIKEQELSRLIEKEIQNICERGCSTNLLKHYYHHIQTLKQLGYVPKAW